MISTDHQRRTSQERLQKFQSALRAVEAAATDENPFIKKVKLRSLKDQIAQLELELREYDQLKAGSLNDLDVGAVGDVPVVLVKARVGRGLSQSALAEKLGVKPQQVQRWESDLYQKASFDTLTNVANALNVKFSGRLSLGNRGPIDPVQLKRRLNEIGLPMAVIENRVFPRSSTPMGFADELDARLTRIVGTDSLGLLAGRAALPVPTARFKLPSSAEQTRTRAYTAYVMALSAIAAKCATAPVASLPKTTKETYELLFGSKAPSFEAAVSACWTLGIPVLALQDSVAFHGACLRIEGRCVIVLKQNSSSSWRWLIDLLHELYHASHEPAGDFTVFEGEETSQDFRDSQDERRATRFAVLCASRGRVDELTKQIADRSDNDIRKMKATTIAVAKEADIPVGLLANLMAFRLAQSGHDWWGVAQNLQPAEDSPWKMARDIFAKRADLSALSSEEQSLLLQALETQHDE
jgi:transcriptional regulator with XRE-family HTH domain